MKHLGVKIFITISLILIVVVVGKFGTTYYAAALLSKSIETLVVPEITLKDATYFIREGKIYGDNTPSIFTQKKILSLVHYSLQARVQPLFSLAGTNVAKYRESIERLREQDEIIASLYGEEEGNYIRETLHPIQYLQELANTEEIRLKFIMTPSDNLAREYHNQIFKTIDVYLAYTNSLLETFTSIASEKMKDGNLIFTNGSITPKRIAEIVSEYSQEIENGKNEAERRWSCYRGSILMCDEITSPLVQKTSNLDSETNDTTPPKNIREIADILRVYRESLPIGFFTNFDTAVINNSACYKNASPVFYSLWHKETNGVSFVRPNILNDLLFVDTHDGKQAGWNYFKEAKK
ncbi:MAG: hypothetical protein JKX80_02950, partial [Candidatus Pacebacteria bacterium]|nr:hypothetical protein [Candidatus Paceibacterota bacterium]